MPDPSFDLHLPAARLSPAVFSSPHSGSEYPAELLARTRLDLEQLRSSEDAFVDSLFLPATAHGAPLIAARLPRAWLDLNRAAEDLDPAVVEGAARRPGNPRIAAGLGVIPRVVAEGRHIQDGKLSMAVATARIAELWHPYHARLGALLDESRAMFGTAILFDCHSMPHDALASAPMLRGRRPDVILGDRFGASCDRWLIEAASEAFTAAGFAVARNAPFAGGYITQRYGVPQGGVQALQIEIDRALYMDERRIEKRPEFDEIAARLAEVIGRVTLLGAGPARLAAE